MALWIHLLHLNFLLLEGLLAHSLLCWLSHIYRRFDKLRIPVVFRCCFTRISSFVDAGVARNTSSGNFSGFRNCVMHYFHQEVFQKLKVSLLRLHAIRFRLRKTRCHNNLFSMLVFPALENKSLLYITRWLIRSPLLSLIAGVSTETFGTKPGFY